MRDPEAGPAYICHHEGTEDCFGRHGVTKSDRCRVLNNTDFGGRKCPFYKSYTQFKLGRALYGNVHETDFYKDKEEIYE